MNRDTNRVVVVKIFKILTLLIKKRVINYLHVTRNRVTNHCGDSHCHIYLFILTFMLFHIYKIGYPTLPYCNAYGFNR